MYTESCPFGNALAFKLFSIKNPTIVAGFGLHLKNIL